MNFTTLVMVTVLVTVGGSEAKRLETGEGPNLNPVLGGFLVGLVLFLFGLASEEIAEDFCYLIIVSSLIINGVPIATALTAKSVGSKTTAVTTTGSGKNTNSITQTLHDFSQ